MKKQLTIVVTLAVILILPYGWESLRVSTWYVLLGVILALSAVWLISRGRSGGPFHLPKATIPLVVYVVFRFITLSYTPLPYYATFSTLSELLVLLMFIFIFDSLWNGWQPRLWENALIAICLVFVVVDLFDMLQYQRAWWSISGSLFSMPPIVKRAPGALLGHPNFLAGYINLVIPLVLVRLLRTTQKRGKVIGFGVLLLLLIGEYLTYSRAGWLALVGAIVVTLLFYYAVPLYEWLKSPRKSIPWRTSRILVVLLAALVLMIPITIYAIYQTQLAGHGSTSMRLAIWGHSLEQFVSSPLWGNGIRSLAVTLTNLKSAIGVDEISHAHNLLLQISAESGIIGLGLVLIVAILIGRAFISAWKQHPAQSRERASLAAYAGIGTGILIHGLADFLFWRATFNIAVLLILALLYYTAPPRESITVKKWIMIPLIAGSVLLFSFGRVITTQEASTYMTAVEAAEIGDWYTARESICKAADATQSATFLGFQCALANARLAYESGDTEMLKSALEVQRKTIGTDPYWYVHWANLASYEWQNGEIDLALEHMEKVAEMAPQRSILWLNLAWMQERVGKNTEALRNYNRVYCLAPEVKNSLFYQGTTLRQSALEISCSEEFNIAYQSSLLSAIEEGKLALAFVMQDSH